MFKFTDEQKAYIIEKMDEQIKNSEEPLAQAKKCFADLKENIDNLPNSQLFGLLSVMAIFSRDEDKPLPNSYWGGFNGKLN